ncbi:MAG: hypothetical protein H6654_03630 [Ardenticatenaceae bacterium]|nr:hypothetical protein [Anaerolineales bacterium]MCB8941268.1 hypothetical protein [Ardenticatenaceae bacterium]MCB8972623.1 hypothetical protein [Ardenticatenaceae bacterium]
MLPSIEHIQFEENNERLKIVIPVKKRWGYFGLYSFMLLIWLGMAGYGLVFTWRMAFSGERFAFVFTVMLLGLLYLLYQLGKMVWQQWQYFAANREILFVHEEMLILRRPVSIFGRTAAFDRTHVTPYYYSEHHHCPAFDYGHQHVYFGHDLPTDPAVRLIGYLNARYHPHADEDDE